MAFSQSTIIERIDFADINEVVGQAGQPFAGAVVDTLQRDTSASHDRALVLGPDSGLSFVAKALTIDPNKVYELRTRAALQECEGSGAYIGFLGCDPDTLALTATIQGNPQLGVGTVAYAVYSSFYQGLTAASVLAASTDPDAPDPFRVGVTNKPVLTVLNNSTDTASKLIIDYIEIIEHTPIP